VISYESHNFTAVDKAQTAEHRTVSAARDAINGKVKGIRALLPFLGPAFIASIAYIDPGNFATNIQSGARFGYKMLWVIVLANQHCVTISDNCFNLLYAKRRVHGRVNE
jgi:Mn2+/Fe2+ NRAMP family transporter